ncbi:isochorismate synthase [Xylanimonas cellulosilytica DSM 15894]|uniref:isochorismate synthase n=1 Tax=Xylanimonas cellulosilytica (strain DSM 15894 / JCM 12276 / CECT 5975 / KCTC 9989 / LMG 20990 / NBRC 107835 / XIL07) TaxID=446471 RepID=D1BW02_XYLCX|nr:isochorismate synthase [Xylanimonas cellulosilytica]ACZ29505.1 isochorismate synthase [Xylanimonas cellulosilytica DSM 15894]
MSGSALPQPAFPAGSAPDGGRAVGAQPLVVRTAPISLPDGGLTTLVDLLPDAKPLAWVRRGDGIVGWGEALRITTTGEARFSDADAAWQSLLDRAVVRDDVRLPGTGPVAFGSFAFDATSDDGGVLVVPRVVVGRRGDRAWITTIAAGLDAAPTAALLDPARRTPVTGPGAVTESDGAVAAADWPAIVADAVERIQAGRLEKVVLARDVVATTGRALDPRWLLRRLAAGYEATWTFSVAGMVGATPELLVRSEKGLVASRVLAGTIRRAPGMTDDDALLHAAQLARSSKDLEEHEHAVVSVARALEPFCTSMNVPEQPFVLHLPNVMHLASDVTGVLDRDATPSSLALAAALHPSAAVCGTPTVPARDLIREIEGMDRGRYAGPVGWTGADGDGEWGIALRSARLDDADPRRVRLFAGCGVVAASDPAAELAESEAKLVPMRWALRG